MRLKVYLALMAVVAVVLAAVWLWAPFHIPAPPQPPPSAMAEPADSAPPPAPVAPPSAPLPTPPASSQIAVTPSLSPEEAPAPLTKAEQLAQIRETYRALAAGDPRTALRAARQLTNDVERETALLALVTEWKQGELSPPRQRAWAIASLGLEAGLGAELAKNPELAQAWASEFTNSPGQAVAPRRLASAMVDADPATAWAYGEQLSGDDRRNFFNSLFTTWAQKDTEAALQRAAQLSDPAEQDAALQAIRSVAPVGIGAELRMQDGYPAINRLFPGMPAELSGQIHPGDRILAVAQGNNVFVDARGLPMQDVVQAIRGAPGTLLQLQVVSADAPPDSTPRTIAIRRDQIKYKQ